MAGRLITNTLVQAFSELGSGSLQHATSKQLPDSASEPMLQEQRNDQYLNTSVHIANSHQTKTNECSNVKSESNYIPLDSRTGTLEHIFAETIVHEVLKCSIREASNCYLRCKVSSLIASQDMMRAFISETLYHDTQELQCVLIWAAASQVGTSILQIDLTDKHIQQQKYFG